MSPAVVEQVCASRRADALNVLSLLGEVDAAMRAAFHLSHATAEAYERLHCACEGLPALVPLRDAYDGLRAAQFERCADLEGHARRLCDWVRYGGARPAVGGLVHHLFTLAYQAPFVAEARAQLYRACEGWPDLAGQCAAYETARVAEAGADSRAHDALRRLMLAMCL